MEVRIRRSSEATARHLTTSTLDKLNKVIPELENWGLGGDDEGRLMTGQIVVGPEGTSAYFEVVVNDDDDPEPQGWDTADVLKEGLAAHA